MKSKMPNLLKYLIFAILFAIVIYIVFYFVCIVEFGDTNLSKTGDMIAMVLFFALPILAFITPFAIKFITKCSFLKMLLYAFISVLIYILLYFGTDLMHFEYINILKASP